MESLFTLHFDLGQKILSLGTYLSPVRVVYKAGGKKRENKNKKGCVLWGIGRVFPTWEFWKSPRVIKIRGFFCCCCSGDPAPGRGCCCFFFFFLSSALSLSSSSNLICPSHLLPLYPESCSRTSYLRCFQKQISKIELASVERKQICLSLLLNVLTIMLLTDEWNLKDFCFYSF